MQNETTVPSILTIEQQKKITMTGVESVDAFSETAIALTVNGNRMQIAGRGLKVLSFSKGSGNFSASGDVSAVKYGGAKGKALQKLFK
ncbi:MAG: YabP/YqfC family sporulation protein [Clostridia bacterium]|nr:YabP/YqfC family sporulation protein [Clostridia bacterium]